MNDKNQLLGKVNKILAETSNFDYQLIIVSKTRTKESISELFSQGFENFGENKVQELVSKYEDLPTGIKWHFIGHLQRNKVKYISSFVHLIHSVDSMKLLNEIEKQGMRINRVINCLLQVYIAKEESKYGLDENELEEILFNAAQKMNHVNILGLMGMATNTTNVEVQKSEFTYLKNLFSKYQALELPNNVQMDVLSMGMSQDYMTALKCGSNMIRVGSSIFGPRNY